MDSDEYSDMDKKIYGRPGLRSRKYLYSSESVQLSPKRRLDSRYNERESPDSFENDSNTDDYTDDENAHREPIQLHTEYNNPQPYSSRGSSLNTDIPKPRGQSEPFEARNNNSSYKYVLLAMVLLVLAVIYYRYMPADDSTKYSTGKRPCEFDVLQKQFPNQDEKLWKSLKCGIESVLNDNPTKPSIYLLLYRDASTEQMIDQITDRAIDCMGTNTRPLKLNKSDFTSAEMEKDYGVAIAKFKPEIVKAGVLLVSDLNLISPIVAQAFHSICDSVSPLVANSVIFLTMHVDDKVSGLNNMEIAENQLKSNWNVLHQDKLQPLLARVTEQVLLLNSE